MRDRRGAVGQFANIGPSLCIIRQLQLIDTGVDDIALGTMGRRENHKGLPTPCCRRRICHCLGGIDIIVDFNQITGCDATPPYRGLNERPNYTPVGYGSGSF